MNRISRARSPKKSTSPRNSKPVIIVGAGPAGLLVSHYLKEQRIDHLILERGQVGQSWRSERWDSLRLTGPKWQFQLPDADDLGVDPNAFMHAKEVVSYIEHYAERIGAPLQCATEVTGIFPDAGGRILSIETNTGKLYEAEQVVATTGIFHSPKIPECSARLPGEICQVTTHDYRRPELLQPGAVLVVGSGESGSQIAEELRAGGRKVYLSVGQTRWLPRRYRGRDFTWWADRLGRFEDSVRKIREGKTTKKPGGLQATGSDSGHDVNIHTLARDGVKLLGRLEDIRDGRLILTDDLRERVAQADEEALKFKAEVDEYIEANGIDAPDDDSPDYCDAYDSLSTESTVELDIHRAGITTVLWATGHRADFSYVRLPVFDEAGQLVHRRWVTPYPGFYFFGFPLLVKACAVEAQYLVSVVASRARCLSAVPSRPVARALK